MKKSIRCCISCILPCGALDVIRIVHSNGRVEEISGTNIKASDIMKAYPKHVLKKPSSPNSDLDAAAAMLPKIVVVPPDAQLQRGKIYFLMPAPAPSAPEKKTRPNKSSSSSSSTTTTTTTTKKKVARRVDSNNTNTNTNTNGNSRSQSRQHRHNSRSMSNASSKSRSNTSTISMATNDHLLISDQYLSEILSEKLSTQRDRRRGRVGVWRPHLESISETPTDNHTSSSYHII